MTREPSAAIALRWCLFSAAYYATYFLSTALPTPVLWYLPTERRFAFAIRPDGIASDLYGRMLWSLLAGVLAYALSRALFRSADVEALKKWQARSLIWSGALFTFTAGLYVYLLINRGG